ncbi:MAG TPA: GTPase ObgE [Verrucomicrobiae bacterium]|nr:GTPase ObgE [Verrucomicrobiae bacterium]
MFIDYAEIRAVAGAGGSGMIAFRREKFVPKGGPSGGDGGAGGSVFARANSQLATLIDCQFKKFYRAGRGMHGSGKNASGLGGGNVFIEMPVGTVIRDKKTGEILADLTEPGQVVLLAKGGRGGRGNARFATPRRRAPQFSEEGEPGEEKELVLELKLLADVGLVGFPNVGKSTLLSAVSAARPKVADYPFTTLIPHLGIVQTDHHRSFVLADLPGLIEGAHLGKGLGHRFLKHIERTRLLIYLLDASSPSPAEDLKKLKNELAQFEPKLVKKPFLVALNKIDLLSKAEAAALKKSWEGKAFLLSAFQHKGTEDLMQAVGKKIYKLGENGKES